LSAHEKLLKKFLALFKRVDTDGNGILNEEEFKQLISVMNFCSEELTVDMLLRSVDPYNNKKITFSDCISLLSSVYLLPNIEN